MNSFSEKFDKHEFIKIKDFFVSKNAEFSMQQYAEFRAKTNNAVAILYSSGKLVIQGIEIDKFCAEFLASMNRPSIIPEPTITPKILCPTEHIGIDESGKGDFFGPLVIAGVLVNEENSKRFIQEGIKDSKKLSDEKILKLAAIIKANAVHSVVTIKNEKYNELYSKFNNLNKLLAWGHARAIENILEKTPCNYAISDKFGNDNLIQNALLEKGKNITLEQRVRGEEDIAVAAASILARAQYVNQMQMLSTRYEVELPKGASDKVLEAAKKFTSLYGQEKLKYVAKLHFKTTTQVK